MAKDEGIMLTKEDIFAAIEESQKVKEQYPSFWRFYEMLIEMNTGLSALQESMEEQHGKHNQKE